MKKNIAEEPLFAEFWSEWRPFMRHTDGRRDARERYRKELLSGADPQDILDGAKGYLRQLASMPKDEQKFIPLAATWLHKQSYADWCDRERAYQAAMAERATRQPKSAPAPLPEPVQADTEDRAAMSARVFAKLGIRPEGMH